MMIMIIILTAIYQAPIRGPVFYRYDPPYSQGP